MCCVLVSAYVCCYCVCFSCGLCVCVCSLFLLCFFFFFQAEDGIRDHCVTGVQTCALPISSRERTFEARCVSEYESRPPRVCEVAGGGRRTRSTCTRARAGARRTRDGSRKNVRCGGHRRRRFRRLDRLSTRAARQEGPPTGCL